MNSKSLRTMQEPFKERYKSRPEAAMITLSAEGTLGDDITCKVQTGKAFVEAGLHAATGGNGLQVCSGDMLLEALVACFGVTLNAVATALDITIRSGSVRAEGDLDFRGTLGVSKEVAVGFQRIRLFVRMDSDATDEQKVTLLRLTERYCVVLQTIARPPELQATYEQ